MTTSGSVSFNLTARQVVDKAFGKIGVKVQEQPLQDAEFQDGKDALNLMIKSKAFLKAGLNLWTKDEGILFLDVGKTDYLLGPNGDEAAQFDDVITAQTTSDLIATDVIIPIDSSAGMAVNDKIGIRLDDNTRFWSTILTVDSSTQVTINDALPSVSASNSSVFTFTNLIQRPNRVLSCRRKTFTQDNEIPVITWSRQQYFDQVNKSSQGTVVNCYYSPQLVDGRMYVWQTASNVNDFLRFTFERQIEDILIGDDTLDFPPEWLEAIIYGLAFRLTDDYNVPLAKADRIGQKANEFLDDLLGWDEEMTSLNLQPDFD